MRTIGGFCVSSLPELTAPGDSPETPDLTTGPLIWWLLKLEKKQHGIKHSSAAYKLIYGGCTNQ